MCLVMESLGRRYFSGLEGGSSCQMKMVQHLWPSSHGTHHRTAFVESAGLQTLLCRPEHFPPDHQTEWGDNWGHTQGPKCWRKEMGVLQQFQERTFHSRQGHSVILGCHIARLTRWDTTPNHQTAEDGLELACRWFVIPAAFYGKQAHNTLLTRHKIDIH